VPAHVFDSLYPVHVTRTKRGTGKTAERSTAFPAVFSDSMKTPTIISLLSDAFGLYDVKKPDDSGIFGAKNTILDVLQQFLRISNTHALHAIPRCKAKPGVTELMYQVLISRITKSTRTSWVLLEI